MYIIIHMAVYNGTVNLSQPGQFTWSIPDIYCEKQHRLTSTGNFRQCWHTLITQIDSNIYINTSALGVMGLLIRSFNYWCHSAGPVGLHNQNNSWLSAGMPTYLNMFFVAIKVSYIIHTHEMNSTCMVL